MGSTLPLTEIGRKAPAFRPGNRSPLPDRANILRFKNRILSSMLKAYRYRLYPTDEQAAFLNRQFGCVRHVYNWTLGLATTTYQTKGQGITRFQWDKRLSALKQE